MVVLLVNIYCCLACVFFRWSVVLVWVLGWWSLQSCAVFWRNKCLFLPNKWRNKCLFVIFHSLKLICLITSWGNRKWKAGNSCVCARVCVHAIIHSTRAQNVEIIVHTMYTKSNSNGSIYFDLVSTWSLIHQSSSKYTRAFDFPPTLVIKKPDVIL